MNTNLDKWLVTGFLACVMIGIPLIAWKFGDHSEVFKWALGAWLFFTGLFGGLINGIAIGRAQAAPAPQEKAIEPPQPLA